MHYFDTSFLVPLFLAENKSEYVESVLQSVQDDRAISQWLRVEFTSIVARYVRMKDFNKSQASSILDSFEMLINEAFYILAPTAADFNLATTLLQHYHAGLRAGDALHLAIAQNHGAKKLYTLDQGLEKAAKTLTNLTIIT